MDSHGRGLKGAAWVKFPTNKAFWRWTPMVLWNGITDSRWQNAQQEYSVSAIIRHGLRSQTPIAWIFSKLPSKPESQGVDEPYCSESRSGLRMFTAWTLTTSSSPLPAASRCLLPYFACVGAFSFSQSSSWARTALFRFSQSQVPGTVHRWREGIWKFSQPQSAQCLPASPL